MTSQKAKKYFSTWIQNRRPTQIPSKEWNIICKNICFTLFVGVHTKQKNKIQLLLPELFFLYYLKYYYFSPPVFVWELNAFYASSKGISIKTVYWSIQMHIVHVNIILLKTIKRVFYRIGYHKTSLLFLISPVAHSTIATSTYHNNIIIICIWCTHRIEYIVIEIYA